MIYYDGKIPFKQHLCTMDPKTVYYYSNGSGRDQFIVNNSGGFMAAKGKSIIYESGFINRKISFSKT